MFILKRLETRFLLSTTLLLAVAGCVEPAPYNPQPADCELRQGLAAGGSRDLQPASSDSQGLMAIYPDIVLGTLDTSVEFECTGLTDTYECQTSLEDCVVYVPDSGGSELLLSLSNGGSVDGIAIGAFQGACPRLLPRFAPDMDALNQLEVLVPAQDFVVLAFDVVPGESCAGTVSFWVEDANEGHVASLALEARAGVSQ